VDGHHAEQRDAASGIDAEKTLFVAAGMALVGASGLAVIGSSPS